jgi:hypothetical protein
VYRSLLVLFVFCMTCAVSYGDDSQPDPAKIKFGLQAIEQSLPAFKESLDTLKVRGQDISYPMVNYTVLENFIIYAREDVDKGKVKRAAEQLSDMEWIKSKLDRELSEALAGKRKFPAVPRWTGDTRPVIKSSSFIAPTTTPGKPGREIRPVFFNGYGHFGQVQADIEKWPNYGTNIIQFETGPWSVFPEEGKVVDPTPGILKNLDRAQKAGVAVNLLLSPHYFPNWMFTKYPELRKQRDYFFPMCLHAPETMELLKKYIKVVVPPLKDHPALHSICISNEPRNVEEPCEYANEEFRAWLKKRHGDIATLNDRWGTKYTDFDEISVPNPFASDAQELAGRWADFARWNQDFFADFHKQLADAVREAAPNVPVHAKVQCFTFGNASEQKCGNDAYLYGQFCDINGNDDSCYYDDEENFANHWLGNGMYYDLQRSIKDVPIFNSENHIIRDRETKYIPARHIRAALWQQAIHGQSATTIWVWERTLDNSSDLAGSIINRPGCARAVGIVNCDLNRAAREVTALQQAPAQILMLHSTSALSYDKEEHDRCMFRIYISLNFTGLKMGFVTERQLEAGIVPKASVIMIPNAKHLSNAAFNTLKKYKGHLVMVGDESLAYDEFNKPRSERLQGFTIPFSRENTRYSDIENALVPKFASWGISPKVTLTDREGKSVWGVEYRQVDTANGTLVNVCNYLKTPVSVKLSRKGKDVKSVDVLSGVSVCGLMNLQPLETRLLRVKG